MKTNRTKGCKPVFILKSQRELLEHQRPKPPAREPKPQLARTKRFWETRKER